MLKRLDQCLMAALVVVAVTPVVADQWQTYSNPRFGSTAEVPGDWRPGEPPVNGDGLEFISPDGRATIAVSGSWNMDGTTAEAIATFGIQNEGEIITYRHFDKRSIVVSGTRGDRIFYAKGILVCRDRVWNEVWIEYPTSEKKKFRRDRDAGRKIPPHRQEPGVRW